jgi:IS5 family transposase
LERLSRVFCEAFRNNRIDDVAEVPAPAAGQRAHAGAVRRNQRAPRRARAADARRHDRDATIIAAPSSTKNEGKARDPEMHQTKKGNAWHFGMKADIGVDAESGLVHSVAQSGLTRGSKRGNEGPCAAAEPLKARAARQTPLTAPDVAHRSARP